MLDLRQYWQEVRTLQGSLPAFVWLMSLDDQKRGMVGGRMAELAADQAAQRLIAKSYRMATDEEIAAHLEKEDQVRRQTVNEGFRRKGIAVVAVPIAAADDKRAATKRR
jgi:predicted dinucleotide-binding enzyme